MMSERISSFIDRGNKLIKNGKTPEAMKIIERGLEYYTKKIIKAINPYAKSDAGLVVLVLRHLADEIERNNPGAKELYEGMKKIVKVPNLKEGTKIKKANKY